MWLSDGTVVEMQTEPGHCYLANFVGVKHQVVHAAAGAEEGRGYTHTPVSSTTLKSSILPAAPFSVISVAPARIGFGRASRSAWSLARARHSARGQQRRNSSSRASPIWRRGTNSGGLGAPRRGAGRPSPRMRASCGPRLRRCRPRVSRSRWRVSTFARVSAKKMEHYIEKYDLSGGSKFQAPSREALES